MGEYPSLRQLADQLSELPVYAPLREHIRCTIDSALGVSRKRPAEHLTEKECVVHCLVAEWLDSNGYKATAQTMKVQMAEKWIDDAKRYLNGSDTVDSALQALSIETKSIERTVIADSNPFPKVSKVEKRKKPIKIAPMTDEQLEETARQQEEIERKRKAMQAKKALMYDANDSDESSEDSTSSSSEGKEEEKPLSWGPSKLALVTDEVSDPLPPIFSSHLPPLSISKPTVSKKEEDAIDALFGDNYDLDDFEELEDEEETKKPIGEGEEKAVEKAVKEEKKKTEEESSAENKDTNEIPLEPLVISDGTRNSGCFELKVPEKLASESIDELEEFDMGLLSSGGSEYSF